jgi:uncharacterized protein (TIGR03032 family)
MKLDTEFIKLPLRFEVERLNTEVMRFHETEWRAHPQGHPGNSALPLIAAHGDPANDATKGPMRPTAHLDRCPYLRQVLAAFDTVLGRTRLMRLDGNAEAVSHTDTNYYWMQRVRIHVPILTDPAVQFVCGGRSLHMVAGEAWIFDTWKRHNVLNPNPTQRIHLVVDTVGSASFWDLVARGEWPFGPAGRVADPPRFVTFQPDADVRLPTETVNQPVVMSPWEQETLLAALVVELAVSESAQAGLVAELKGEMVRFQREWRSLWARFGEAANGWDAFRQVLQQFDRRLARFEQRLRLPNGSETVEIVRQMVVRPALNPDLASQAEGPTPTPTPANNPPPRHPAPDRSPVRPGGVGARRIERPIIIVAPPRSGTSLLFETLAQSPSVGTIGGESHAVIENIPRLHPAHGGFASNRLDAADADPSIIARLEAAFLERLRDRDGQPPAPGSIGLRLLEKTPKNALRVPFLAAAFPDAIFIYLYRDPRETVSSILDAWRSRRFVTYPQLPDWDGPPWSLLLIPGWRDLARRPLAEIAAMQWVTTARVLLDDLEALPAERWCVASYDRLLAEPQAEIERLCAFTGIVWDRRLTTPLPQARHTLTSPAPEKWRRNAEELKPVMPLIGEIAERAREVFARPPAKKPAPRRSPAEAAPTPAPVADLQAFRSVYTANFPRLLGQLGISLLVSTYQSGRVIVVRADSDQLNTHLRFFPSPMGIAIGPHALAIGTQRAVWEYRNQPAVAHKLDPPGKHDACFLPRSCHVTGDIRVHELAFAGEELWIVNTRFSCLATLDNAHSFVPRWRPPFVSQLAAEDRCHLNGLAVVDGRVRFVTALGETDAPQGWRENKAAGGVVMDVDSGEILLRGLSMPHSPRWYGGRFWLLESGKGTLAVADLAAGRVETLAELPGFTRGLGFAGPYAFVGLSQVRESLFGGIPLTERLKERTCGVCVLDLRSGRTVAFLRFEGTVQEIFDVQVLHGVRFPEIAEPEADLVSGSFALPAAALAELGHADARSSKSGDERR